MLILRLLHIKKIFMVLTNYLKHIFNKKIVQQESLTVSVWHRFKWLFCRAITYICFCINTGLHTVLCLWLKKPPILSFLFVIVVESLKSRKFNVFKSSVAYSFRCSWNSEANASEFQEPLKDVPLVLYWMTMLSVLWKLNEWIITSW